MKLGSGLNVAMFLVAASFLLAASEARTIVVGGSENWHSGFNYTDWALKNTFFIDDKLVFKYNPPSKNHVGYSVYLLPNLYSYITCDFRNAKLLANPSQGGGQGFVYALKEWRPQYFASGEGNGAQCRSGMMKFFAVPLPHWNN